MGTNIFITCNKDLPILCIITKIDNWKKYWISWWKYQNEYEQLEQENKVILETDNYNIIEIIKIRKYDLDLNEYIENTGNVILKLKLKMTSKKNIVMLLR